LKSFNSAGFYDDRDDVGSISLSMCCDRPGQDTSAFVTGAAMDRTTGISLKQWLSASAILVAAAASTGCQIDVAGQTLPSPYYQYDDIQYHPAGPEFKLSNEAAAMKAYRAEDQLGNY
jgi:hypothetical protein